MLFWTAEQRPTGQQVEPPGHRTCPRWLIMSDGFGTSSPTRSPNLSVVYVQRMRRNYSKDRFYSEFQVSWAHRFPALTHPPGIIMQHLWLWLQSSPSINSIFLGLERLLKTHWRANTNGRNAFLVIMQPRSSQQAVRHRRSPFSAKS